jgi:glucosamine-6-phosphate deaminase
MLKKYNTNSKVETYLSSLPNFTEVKKGKEHIQSYIFDNYILLGQAVALRFLEWSSLNPGGMVALPTGKTPEFFIKWVQYYLSNWNKEASTGLLGKVGLKEKPDIKSLYFVMLDEFFPINPTHERSFQYFIKRFYIDGFGFDSQKARLIDTWHFNEKAKSILGSDFNNIQEIFPAGKIDLSLRIKLPSSKQEELQQKTIKLFDQYCEDYEEYIRQFGGIGFFLGGIGPDGHIAFNVKGSSHHSHTRLTNINYETQATAAVDLGGIEIVRKKAVITMGLETITYNPDTVAIIMAAGEAKSKIIADALEQEPALEYPASVLHKLSAARFYLTKGASSKLKERKKINLLKATTIPDKTIYSLVIEGANASNIKLQDLVEWKKKTNELLHENFELAEKLSGKSIQILSKEILSLINEGLEKGLSLPKNNRILHTGPHHDDIELAYFPLLHHLVRSPHNDNHFCYCTSGFTSVTNVYVEDVLKTLKEALKNGRIFKDYSFERLTNLNNADDDITGILHGIAQQAQEEQVLFVASRMARKLCIHEKLTSADELLRAVEIQIAALKTIEPGNREPEIFQLLKGWLREFEAELVWAHFGINLNHVSHLNLKFYTGDIFVEYPDMTRDVAPIFELLEKTRPNVISLALDPEGSGPDTHMKTLIALAFAIDKYVVKYGSSSIRIWGYRNVWSRFELTDTNMIVPVSLNSFAVLHNMFNNCFISQKSASFPSHELDGTFSEVAQKVWVEQHEQLIKLLGKEYFYQSPNPMLRRSYGAIYLKDMSYDEFKEEFEYIRKMIEVKNSMG